MYLHKINDKEYVNTDLITQIYWNRIEESWAFDVAGQSDVISSYLMTEEEKNKLVAVMQMHNRTLLN